MASKTVATAAALLSLPFATQASSSSSSFFSWSNTNRPPQQQQQQQQNSNNWWNFEGSADKAFYTNSDLPNNAWSVDDDGTGFMAAADPEAIEYMRNYQQQQQQRRATSSSNSYHYRDYFADGSETFWPEGAQAWRLLGFYIDCYAQEQGYNGRRNLQGEDENNGDYESGACVRYLLWAAVRIPFDRGGGATRKRGSHTLTPNLFHLTVH